MTNGNDSHDAISKAARLRFEIENAAHDVSECGLLAQERAGERNERGVRARAYFEAWARLLGLYAQKDNFPGGGTALNILPPDLALQLKGLFGYLAVGKIPDPIAHCVGRGNLVGPSEERDIRAAVVYVVAAKRGIIADKYPIKSVQEAYSAQRQSVQGWVVARRKGITDAELIDADAIAKRMREAGARYSTDGRTHSANIEKAKG
jgi:hypothetical protein